MITLLNTSQLFNNIWYTVHHAKPNIKNKMDTYTSIALPHNHICHERRRNKGYNKNTVCERCYSYVQSSIHPQIRSKMDINGTTLNDPDYKPSKIKTINNCLRYISFGDLSNETQAINILKHAKHNPTLHKAIWSKQVKYLTNAIKQTTPIKHMNYIWSCSKLNCTTFIIPKHFTKSFYVYTTEEELNKAKDIATTKGFQVVECSKMCKECNVCYKNHEQSIVMELLK